MKTTIDLPDELVCRLKLRAVREGKKLKEAAAEALRAGLAGRAGVRVPEPVVVLKDKKTGLPVIQCRRTARRADELTPDRVADILIEQETGWTRESA
jgi:plasmid stability protein